MAILRCNIQKTNDMKLVRQDFTMDFLRFLVETYGFTIQRSYRKIAADTGSISFVAVQHHILKLEAMGIITIENKGTRYQVLHISEDKFNEYVKPCQQD